MKNRFFPLQTILIGLAVSQILASGYVFVSNLKLLERSLDLAGAGYLVVPNEIAQNTLDGIRPALAGGLFFTLTVGAGLTMAALVLAWLFVRVFKKSRFGLGVSIWLWLVGLLAMNMKGPAWPGSLFMLLVPPPVFFSAVRKTPPPEEGGSVRGHLLFLGPFLIMALFWGTQWSQNFFLDIRDFLFWSNPIGRSVSDFYYKYTLYPAEAFKSLNQMTLRRVKITDHGAPDVTEWVERVLMEHDYLPLQGAKSYELELEVSEQSLSLSRNSREILQVGPASFLADPQKYLKRFSDLTDSSRSLRRAAFFGLMAGTPLMVYVLFFAFFHGVVSYRSPKYAALIAGVLCLSLGSVLAVPVLMGKAARSDRIDPAEFLASDSWRTRLAALRRLERLKFDPLSYPGFQGIWESPHLPERYWAARVLVYSRRREAYHILMKMLDDPQSNIRYMAFRALGLRRETRAEKEIILRLETMENWYVQWYAYRALRNMGWRQKK